jgi:chorismate mutase
MDERRAESAGPSAPAARRRRGPPSGKRQALVADIEALRDEIDRLDERLVDLLSQRAGCALEIGRIKRILDMEIYQPAREDAVLRHVRGVNQGPLDGDAIARLFERIIDEARRLERIMATQEHEP